MLVPEDSIHHSPQVESIVDAALDLPTQEIHDVRTIEVALAIEIRFLKCRKASPAEAWLLKPFVHRRTESLLAAIEQVVVHVRFGQPLENAFADPFREFVRRWHTHSEFDEIVVEKRNPRLDRVRHSHLID